MERFGEDTFGEQWRGGWWIGGFQSDRAGRRRGIELAATAAIERLFVVDYDRQFGR